MKHSFIDKYSDLDSPLHRIDPRIKLVSVFSALVIIVSEPRGEIFPFIFYGLITGVLILMSRIPPAYIFKRCLVVLPFIFLASLFYPLSAYIVEGNKTAGIDPFLLRGGISVFLKAYTALILLILLTSAEKFHNLLQGLRRLKMPRILGIMSALMYRYVFIIHDEVLRTSRARESRTPGKLLMNRFRVYGNFIAMVFIRSLERSEIIYNSMLSRGFKGEFPGMEDLSLTGKDLLASSLFIIILITIRLTNQALFCYFFN